MRKYKCFSTVYYGYGRCENSFTKYFFRYMDYTVCGDVVDTM